MVSSKNHCQTKAFFLNKKYTHLVKIIGRILSLPFPNERSIASEVWVDVHMITNGSNGHPEDE